MDGDPSKDQLATLSDLLDREWDPIGVYAGPEDDWPVPGEYASYAPAVLLQLRTGKSPDEIEAYLRTVAESSMGLRATGVEKKATTAIFTWWRSEERPTYEAMEAYLGRVHGLFISLTGTLSPEALDRAQHLADHGEPAEGVLTVAWTIVNEGRDVPASCIEAIFELTDGIVPRSDLPPGLSDRVVR